MLGSSDHQVQVPEGTMMMMTGAQAIKGPEDISFSRPDYISLTFSLVERILKVRKKSGEGKIWAQRHFYNLWSQHVRGKLIFGREDINFHMLTRLLEVKSLGAADVPFISRFLFPFAD